MSEKTRTSYSMYGASESLPAQGWKWFGKRFDTFVEARNAIKTTVVNKKKLGWIALKIERRIFVLISDDKYQCYSSTIWMDVESIEKDGETIYFH